MKNNNGFQNQVIDSAQSRRERFPLPYDVYTTAEIGEIQCAGVTPLQAGSKTTFKSRDVVRMLPMVCPTLGRIKMKTWHHFVGMSDLIHSWSALLTKQVIGSASDSMLFRPIEVLHINLNELASMCLVGAHYSVYVFQSDEDTGDTSPDGDRSKWHLYSFNTSVEDAAYLKLRNWLTAQNFFITNTQIPNAYPNYDGGWVNVELLTQGALTGVTVPCDNQAWQEFMDLPDEDIGADPYEPVNLDYADKVFRVNNDGDYYAIAVRYSAFGKRFRKMLLGAGYQDNFDDDTPVEIMSLLAIWKAYFDTFGLTYWHSWESSFAKILCQRFDNDGNSNLHVAPAVAANHATIRFFLDLGNCFYTEDKDYIAAHTTQDANLTAGGESSYDKNRGWLNNIVLDTHGGGNNGLSGIGQVIGEPTDSTAYSRITRHVFINRTNHTEVDAELLKILYKWTNRETAAGRRIAELLRAAGYGKYVDEQSTNFIGYEEIELDVTDVNVTADSQNVVAGKDSVAGEYVGKGVGVKSSKDAKTFSFENKEFGYWVTLTAIVVDAGYSQGIEQYHRALDADHFYNYEFDGAGKELEPMNVLIGNCDWSNQVVNNVQFKKSFGMVPRHSLWKVKKNILNGDYSLRGGRDYFLPYSCDKWLDVGDRECVLVPNAGKTYRAVKKLQISDLPVAGQAWRFLNRYPWLANFERIFTYFGTDIRKFLQLLSDVKGLARWEYCHQSSDHFNIQMLCDLECYAPMRPIAESYGTTDENNGHGDYTIKAS